MTHKGDPYMKIFMLIWNKNGVLHFITIKYSLH